jgi:hypothetical protein
MAFALSEVAVAASGTIEESGVQPPFLVVESCWRSKVIAFVGIYAAASLAL